MEIQMSPKLYKLLNIVDQDFYQKVYSVDLLKFYMTKVAQELMSINHLNQDISFYLQSHDHIFGSFSHRRHFIGINRRYFDLFDHFKETNNIFYIYKLLETLVHELRHYAQHSPDVKMPAIIKNYAICSKFATAIFNKSHPSHNLLEIDARYYCYQLFQKHPKMAIFANSVWHINQENYRKCHNDFSVLDYAQKLDEHLSKPFDISLYKKALVKSVYALIKTDDTHKFNPCCPAALKPLENEGEKIYYAIAPLFSKKELALRADFKNMDFVNSQVQDFFTTFRQKSNLKKEEERC